MSVRDDADSESAHADADSVSAQAHELLGRLYREHADFVWRVLLRFGILESQAEDVAHEVFLVVRRRLPDFDTSAPFRPWIYGIARGVSANVRRSEQRSAQLLRVVAAPDDPPTPEDQLRQTQAAALVERFLATLPAAQREAFVLMDIEGMRGPEAADALRENVNVVYSRLRLARARFASFVESTTQGAQS